MDMDANGIYQIFGGKESYEDWFKTTLLKEMQRRLMTPVRVEFGEGALNQSFVIPTELM
jgi:hypothetical protein